MAVGDRISGWVAATGQPMINAEAGLDLLDVPAPALRAAIAVPCSGPAGAKVVLTLYSAKPDAFSSLHHRLLSAAASFVQSIGSQRQARIECVNSDRTSQVPWRQRTRRSGLPAAVSSHLRNPSLTRSLSAAEAAISGRTLTHETFAAGCDALARDIPPIDDLRSTADYRLRVARNLLGEFLSSAVA